MLGKELFAGGGNLSFTHIVNVQLNPDDLNKVGYHGGSAGGINPLFVTTADRDNREIIYFYADLETTYLNIGIQGYNPLFLGRADNKQYLGLVNMPSFLIRDYTWDQPIFNSNDAGKYIPIWLATDPPPWA